jgi:hypothetical protein
METKEAEEPKQMKQLNLLSYFYEDLKNNAIMNYNKIDENLNKKNFLGKIPNDKMEGAIERNGDLFLGVINNEPFDLKLTLYSKYSNETLLDNIINNINDYINGYTNPPLYEIIIKANQSSFISPPLNMIGLYRKNSFNFKFERIDKTWLSWTTFFLKSPLHTEFIYGYLLDEPHKKLSLKSFIYYNKDYYFKYNYGRFCSYKSMYNLIYSSEDLNYEFNKNFSEGKYDNICNDELYLEFKKYNTHWVELIY